MIFTEVSYLDMVQPEGCTHTGNCVKVGYWLYTKSAVSNSSRQLAYKLNHFRPDMCTDTVNKFSWKSLCANSSHAFGGFPNTVSGALCHAESGKGSV